MYLRPDGIRIATPLRMLFGLAEQFNQHRFERAAEDVWHKGLVSPEDAAEYLAAIRRSGRSGVSTYEAWLERLSFRTRPAQSGLEVRLLELIARIGLPAPERQFPLLLANGELVHLDIAWPAARLAVEPGHSWWHGGDLRQRHSLVPGTVRQDRPDRAGCYGQNGFVRTRMLLCAGTMHVLSACWGDIRFGA